MMFEKRSTVLICMVLASISLALVYLVSVVQKTQSTEMLFHLLLAINAVLISYVLAFFIFKDNKRSALIFASMLLMLLCLRLFTSVVSPPDILMGPDLKYEAQIIGNMADTGHIMEGVFTGEATGYMHYPGLELNILSLSMITGLTSIGLLKYLGAFLGVLFIILAERFFHALFNDRSISMPSAVLLGLCPFLIGINSFTIHQSLGIVFLCIFMWGLLRPGIRWKIIGLIAVAGIFATHSLTSYMLVIICVLMFAYLFAGYKWYRIKPRKSLGRKQITIMLALLGAIAVLAYYFTPPEVQRGLQRVWTGLSSSLTTLDGFSLDSIMPVGTKPAWMMAVQLAGFLVFGLAGLWFIARSARNRERESLVPAVFGMVGFTVFIGFLGIWISGLQFAGELQWRGLIYLFLFCSPLCFIMIKKAVTGIGKINSINGRPALLKAATLALPVLLIAPIAMNGVYHGLPQNIYGHDAPYNYADHRLPLDQWASAAEFSKPLDSLNYSFGVRMAWEWVGALGQKLINPLTYEGSLYNWTLQNTNNTIILRESMVEHADYQELVPAIDLEMIKENNDLLYDNGEVLIIFIPE